MEKWINQAPETREQVDTNEANLLENTRGRLAEILEQVWKIPEGLKSFAERFKFDKKTWWAVFLSAMIFATGTGVAKWADNIPYGAEELREISTQLSEEGITEANWERMRQVASYFDEVDEDVIRNCWEKDIAESLKCRWPLPAKSEKLREQISLERQERLRTEREQLAAEEEQLRVINNNLEVITNFLDWTWEIDQEVYEAANFISQRPWNFDPRIVDLANQIIQNY